VKTFPFKMLDAFATATSKGNPAGFIHLDAEGRRRALFGGRGCQNRRNIYPGLNSGRAGHQQRPLIARKGWIRECAANKRRSHQLKGKHEHQ
jgi:hypothetical protein